jgi:ribosomal protein S6E (S10)
MFFNEELQAHLEESSTIKTQSVVIAEWNMNIPTNISKIGNYRYRPNTADSIYKRLPATFDINDDGNYYTNATDADVKIDGGVDDDGIPTTLKSVKEKTRLLYSLEDCFKQFRPRSGINKARNFPGTYLHHANIDMASRPRYYMADKNDGFKYWTSFRTEDGLEYGVANKVVNGQIALEDAAPFVVYTDPIPANRLVVKMQTHIGTVDLGSMTYDSKVISDPLFGNSNKSTPVKWKIQYLSGTSWLDAISFDSSSVRRDGSPIIGSDGYVELSYGLKVPDKYRNTFTFADTVPSESLLPKNNIQGYAYLVLPSENVPGTYHIWHDNKYETFSPEYGWQLLDQEVNRLTNFVTDLTSPSTFRQLDNGTYKYREFEYIRGVRVVVDSMTKNDATFDLIEISPRLTVDLTDKVTEYSITKSASDLGVSGMPVGQLLASTGNVTIFDHDDSFSPNNTNSIIQNYISRHIQFKFYEAILDVSGYDYYIPIKTLYSENFPKISNSSRTVSLELRDLFFYLESTLAPQLLLTDTSTSSAVALLLDSVGFANYTFRRVEDEPEVTIPYFFIPPDTSVAQILQQIAVSTQTAMFFDEYNNFVTMSKNYMMPSESERETDTTLIGTIDYAKDGAIKNKHTNTKLSNIIELTDQSSQVYNDGSINYTSRYIQKTVGSIKQASMIDIDKAWVYKPVLLWEVAGTENTKSMNNEVGNQSSYVLGAIALNSELTKTEPKVVNNQVVNNTIDFGESVYWMTRYNGYFYANGEVIKFDAVQYNVPGYGNVWISDVQEYQNYFSKLKFGGKIYPTGLVRIYSEPNYIESGGVLKLKNGPVAKHGRGQFGTPIVNHPAGLSASWTDNSNVRGCTMFGDRLFTTMATTLPESTEGLSVPSANEVGAGKTAFLNVGSLPEKDPLTSDILARQSTRNGVIKNFMSSTQVDQSIVNTIQNTQAGTVQSSALVINGPALTTFPKPRDFISYVYKPLSDKYKHFGTRMRIIGRIDSSDQKGQTATGSDIYYTLPGSTPDQFISITGGSGGLAVMVNPDTNVGYYFELAALGISTSPKSTKPQNVNNAFFYKIMKDENGNGVPVKLWEGLGNIVVDDGNFVGQYRVTAEQNPTVYDLSVEYQEIGSIRRFYLYINNTLVKTVDDANPLPAYNNMAMFVRGSAKVMFENIYALTNNYSQNTSYALDTPVASIFDASEINANDSFRKYAMSGMIQGTYLSGIGSAEPPKYKLYFDEFGTIMREAAAFNIRYDKAYPALYAKLSPTFNSIKGYTVSGFRAGSYGAEFMVFNATDTALSLDEQSGNYLRIQGVTFTQASQGVLKVDDYFSKYSSMSDPTIENNTVAISPFKVSKDYEDIKLSRMTYGKKDFSLDVPYVQSQDDATNLMKWIISKVMKPRKSMGVKVFSMPTIQLGDIVKVDYVENGVDKGGQGRYVVYNIQYSRTSAGPDMTLFLSEVI